ncbi:PTS sugar transporter subunit IIA [Paenirhodobacter enshiensis]|uniref:PTS sugar transporter subunit IIA n=1 Tax=Paenirhodobacter enshiensis TaxID=1105367 RepID=UPI0013782A0D
MIHNPNQILLQVDCDNTGELFHPAAAFAADAAGLPRDRVLEGPLWRESLGPTAIGQSVALPHARVDHAPAPIALLLHLRRPVAFDAEDRTAVDIVFTLLFPAEQQREVFSTLRWAAAILSRAEVQRAIRRGQDRQGVHAYLTSAFTIGVR